MQNIVNLQDDSAAAAVPASHDALPKPATAKSKAGRAKPTPRASAQQQTTVQLSIAPPAPAAANRAVKTKTAKPSAELLARPLTAALHNAVANALEQLLMNKVRANPPHAHLTPPQDAALGVDLFAAPVDPVALGLPKYFEKVKRPMDLGTVQAKLQSGEYKTLGECYEDISLVWLNCRHFNTVDSFVVRCSFACEKWLDEELLKQVTVADNPALAAAASSNTGGGKKKGKARGKAAGKKEEAEETVQPQPVPSAAVSSAPIPELPPRTRYRDADGKFKVPPRKDAAELSPADEELRTLLAEFAKVEWAWFQYGLPVLELLQPADRQAYLNVVPQPMDLELVTGKLFQGEYKGSAAALDEHIKLMFNNCRAFVPDDAVLMWQTDHLEVYWDDLYAEHTKPPGALATRRLAREAIVHPSPIQPRSVYFKLVKALTTPAMVRSHSYDFLHPVDPSAVPDYLDVVKEPSDLGTILEACKKDKYQTYGEFVHAVRVRFQMLCLAG
jgi:hypothetical protein